MRAVDLDQTAGFLVSDARGRVVGRVERSAASQTPDALHVRIGRLRWRRCLVPAAAIAAIDHRTKVVGLRIDRESLEAVA